MDSGYWIDLSDILDHVDLWQDHFQVRLNIRARVSAAIANMS